MSFDDAAPTLGDLRWIFFAVVQVLERYQLWGVRPSFRSSSRWPMLIHPSRPTVGFWFLSSMNAWTRFSMALLWLGSFTCSKEARRFGTIYEQPLVLFSPFRLKKWCV